MRAFHVLVITLLSACRAPSYETYTQLDPANEQGKVFVLVLIAEQPKVEDRPDTAMATFVLAPGEKKSETVGNKHYPTYRYYFSVEAMPRPNGSVAVEVLTRVSNEGSVRYSSKQRVHGWKVFQQAVQGDGPASGGSAP